MSAITCDQVRAALLDPGTVPGDLTCRPDAAGHIQGCLACQDWLDAYAAGERAWAAESADAFAVQVIAITAGAEAVLRDLPLLAEMDPGAGFAERVLLATSRKRALQGWRARVSDAWGGLVRRPRFAWEAAYVATVCWVLVFGNPVGAIEWSATNIGAVARERLEPPVKELRADLEAWRGRRSPDRAPAHGAAAVAKADQVPPVVRAWQTAASWLRDLTTPVVEAFRLAWGSIAGVFERPACQPSGTPTEPRADAARSPQ